MDHVVEKVHIVDEVANTPRNQNEDSSLYQFDLNSNWCFGTNSKSWNPERNILEKMGFAILDK